MEIHGQPISRTDSLQGADQAKPTKEKAKSEQTSALPQSPAVEVSEKGRQLSELSEIVGNSSDIRSDLVNEMKAKIEAGDYQVDFDKLAANVAEDL